jgi:GGDEF domain-containing protein
MIFTDMLVEIASCKSSLGAFGRALVPTIYWLGSAVMSLPYSVNVDRDTASAIAHRFIASLEGEIQAEGHSHIIGASIGAVLIPDDGANAEEVIHHADLAMYRAKGQDQSSVVFFEPTATRAEIN